MSAVVLVYFNDFEQIQPISQDFLLLTCERKTRQKKNTNEFIYYRTNRPEVFCTNGILKNLAKFTGKRLCQSLFFNKVTGLPGSPSATTYLI